MKMLYLFRLIFLGSFTIICTGAAAKLGCLEKEKALASLETAESLLTKATNSIPSCKDDINSTDQSECGKKKPLAYIEISKKLISDVRRNFPKCSDPIVEEKKEHEKLRDCSEILARGHNDSGVYTIWLEERNTSSKPVKVYCDMKTDDGGWTVIQRRGKFPVQQNFYLDYESYKNGFGNISEEFWLGNENIRVLCQDGCQIRFDLQDEKGEKGFAIYRNFTLSSSNYRLSIGGYSGNVGDGMVHHNNNDFSTKDRGDTVRADKYWSGWFHGTVGYYCNVNGLYQPGLSNAKTVGWFIWRSYKNLASVEIKVKQY